MPLARKSELPKSEVIPTFEYQEDIYSSDNVELRANIPKEMAESLQELAGLLGGMSMSELMRLAGAVLLDRFSGGYDVLLARKVEATGLTAPEVRKLIREKYERSIRRKSKNLRKGA